jgi:ribonuclease HI
MLDPSSPFRQSGTGTIEFLNALSVIVVAVIAIAAFLREGLRARRNRRSVNAHISVDAHALRRQINKWLSERWPTADDPGSILRKAHEIVDHFDIAERRSTDMVRAAANASKSVAEGARRAHLLFYDAADRINDVVASGMTKLKAAPKQPERTRASEELHQQMSQARFELEQCVEALNKAVGEELSRHAKTLKASPVTTSTSVPDAKSR